MLISLIIFGIFNSIIFTKNNIVSNENINKENNQEYNENNSGIKVKEVSFKKRLGYTILNQTIFEKEEKQNFFDNCCGCFILLLICMKCYPKSTCLYECDYCKCDCSLYKCCKDCCSCCFTKSNFEQREMEICILYQEKRKIKWFKDFINNKKQKFWVQLIFLIAYFRTFSIGKEVLYKEANENNKNQENIILQLIVSFSAYTFASTISGYYLVKQFKINYFRLFKIEMQEIM